jgi:hypothetical protein
VVELVDTPALGAGGRKPLGVRVPPPAFSLSALWGCEETRWQRYAAPMRKLSLWSDETSFLSVGSRGSLLSVGSVGSALSIGSVGSVGSAFSIGSAGSLGSVLSARTTASALSWKASGALLGETEKGRAGTVLAGVLVAITACLIVGQARSRPG